MFVKPDNWSDLNLDEKIQVRLDHWVSVEGIEFESPEAEPKYRERIQLFRDAVEMKNTSRVPSVPSVGEYALKRAGLTEHDMLYNPEATVQPMIDFTREFDPDSTLLYLAVPGRVLDLMDYKLYVWAGHGLKEDKPYQMVEGEYMMSDEYPELLRDPSGFFLQTYLPRVCGTLAPLAKMPNLPLIQEIVLGWVVLPFNMPDVQEMLNKLMEAGNVASQCIMSTMKAVRELKAMGFPSMGGGAFCKAPFDQIGDTMRGTRGIFMDMYRQPDNVLAACERMLEISLHDSIKSCNSMGAAFAMFPLHKGADGFMSQEQFEKFYWPGLKKFMEGLNEEGIIPVLFAEGSYNDRLETIADYPKGRSIWYFDQTDMRRAKEILGDVACIQGNVPSSMMQTASVDRLKAYCEELLEIFADDGGFILANGCNIDKTTDEHVRTMIEVVRQQ
jgi:hypothetical protein